MSRLYAYLDSVALLAQIGFVALCVVLVALVIGVPALIWWLFTHIEIVWK